MRNLSQMLKQAQEVQAKMAAMQEKLQTLEVEGQSGGGLVKITMNGKGEVMKTSIDPSLLLPQEGEVLEDLIVAAARDGRAKADAAAQEEMRAVTGGIDLPPGLSLPF